VATDPEYSTFAARLKNREQVTQELDAVLTTATTAEWISRLGGKSADRSGLRRAAGTREPVCCRAATGA
jgi:crotonobetainyl-CoA:carnitine CoA-transferase CaiB-like acyl-CoA transferase